MAKDPQWYRTSVAAMILVHTILVAMQARWWSPTVDEIAHLPAGISHWTLGQFDLYRVNPPLVRMIAAVPIVIANPASDWSGLTEEPYVRHEFGVGREFARINGARTFDYIVWARWMCLPITVIGAWFCHCWARELYGPGAGLIALCLYCFCPNVTAYAALITPDAGSASFGILAGYWFWRWLQSPTIANAVYAGSSLGLALLTKSTWAILFLLWPMMLIGKLLLDPGGLLRGEGDKRISSAQRRFVGARQRLSQLAVILCMGLYMLNLGYGFSDTGKRLDSFHFISRSLGGANAHVQPGNRFNGSYLGHVPIPLPSSYVLGIDCQRYEFEVGKWSYLRGQHKFGGWWYYYAYALLVKVPLGTIGLCVLAAGMSLARSENIRRDMAVLIPAGVIVVVVSSQTGFSRHLRYILPVLPFTYVWLSQIGSIFDQWVSGIRKDKLTNSSVTLEWQAAPFGLRGRVVAIAGTCCIAASIVSSLSVWPHELSYFNELVGGPTGGTRHLLDSNIDWGQDLMYFKEWQEAHPAASPLFLTYFGSIDPQSLDVSLPAVPRQPRRDVGRSPAENLEGPSPGWHAISVNCLYGYKHDGNEADRYAYLRAFHPVARAGYSILIFHLTVAEVNELRAGMNMPLYVE